MPTSTRVHVFDPAVATTAFMKEDREGKVFVAETVASMGTEEAALATRSIAARAARLDATRVGGATVVSAYSPRIRPGVPVSFPVAWDELHGVAPKDFTVHTARKHLGERNPWAERMPPAQRVSGDLVEEGRAIPAGRVAAMHEGERRARANRDE